MSIRLNEYNKKNKIHLPLDICVYYRDGQTSSHYIRTKEEYQSYISDKKKRNSFIIRTRKKNGWTYIDLSEERPKYRDKRNNIQNGYFGSRQ